MTRGRKRWGAGSWNEVDGMKNALPSSSYKLKPKKSKGGTLIYYDPSYVAESKEQWKNKLLEQKKESSKWNMLQVALKDKIMLTDDIEIEKNWLLDECIASIYCNVDYKQTLAYRTAEYVHNLWLEFEKLVVLNESLQSEIDSLNKFRNSDDDSSDNNKEEEDTSDDSHDESDVDIKGCDTEEKENSTEIINKLVALNESLLSGIDLLKKFCNYDDSSDNDEEEEGTSDESHDEGDVDVIACNTEEKNDSTRIIDVKIHDDDDINVRQDHGVEEDKKSDEGVENESSDASADDDDTSDLDDLVHDTEEKNSSMENTDNRFNDNIDDKIMVSDVHQEIVNTDIHNDNGEDRDNKDEKKINDSKGVEEDDSSDRSVVDGYDNSDVGCNTKEENSSTENEFTKVNNNIEDNRDNGDPHLEKVHTEISEDHNNRSVVCNHGIDEDKKSSSCSNNCEENDSSDLSLFDVDNIGCDTKEENNTTEKKFTILNNHINDNVMIDVVNQESLHAETHDHKDETVGLDHDGEENLMSSVKNDKLVSDFKASQEVSDNVSGSTGPNEGVFLKRCRRDILIISKSGSTFAEVMKKAALADKAGAMKVVTSIKKISGEKAMFFLHGSPEDRARCMEELSKIDLMVTSPVDKLSSVHIKGFTEDITECDLVDHLKCIPGMEHIEWNVTNVRPASWRSNGLCNATVKAPEEAIDRLMKAGRIKVGLLYCKVLRPETFLQCYKCRKLGHVAKVCDGPDLSSKCYNCGGDGHFQGSCTNPPKCFDCEGLHRTGSSLCSIVNRKKLKVVSGSERQNV